ncbi:two component transcriptional regulator, LytTR family [Hymenobacter daecheongensis DSM 21074]|uniref:Two component transcriptional regulator, LytTR family n=1 Tax=Hymenobacter daecheongensis DSM 21074 TaxID=1121955 RepID=A0A1M6IWJ0_9BACT|nr:response regulator [Hymenobacter daecheongensis]SHJ38823.1 two component transcriptional regulator, LytTR family [Hymenobacter daecheongensis DSM 21074]
MEALLIDDEPLALRRLASLLSQYPADVRVVGQAANGQEGLAMVRALRPDVIFLDIEMPLLNGFELLAQLEEMPSVVFTTAYDHYAVQAFEQRSIDYLLKPIESARLAKTIARLRRTRQEQAAGLNLDDLGQFLQHLKPAETLRSLSVKSGDKILLLSLSDISYFESQERYVFVRTVQGQQHLTNYTIAALEEKLPAQFVRISRSCIVNTLHINNLQRYFGGKFLVTLTDRAASCLETGTAYGTNLKRLMEL